MELFCNNNIATHNYNDYVYYIYIYVASYYLTTIN